MAHQIDMSNERENMVYVGNTPWHRLGTHFTGDETLDEWRVAAGFDWTAEDKELRYSAQHAAGHEVDVVLPSHRALVRSDTNMVLGVVGKDYKVVQPEQVLEFFRDIAFASDGLYEMETAGCLFDGKRVWALAKRSDELNVGGVDIIKPYLLFGTGFDTTISTFASHTVVRVVCHNTCSAAVGQNCENADVRIPHSSTFDEDTVKRALGLIEDAESSLGNFQATASELALRNVDDGEMFNYFAGIYGPKREEGQTVADLRIGDFTVHQKRNIDQLIRLFKGGPGSDLPTANGTAWGLANAVTHFEDFSKGKNDVRRLQSSGFGAGKNRKKQAFAEAFALCA